MHSSQDNLIDKESQQKLKKSIFDVIEEDFNSKNIQDKQINQKLHAISILPCLIEVLLEEWAVRVIGIQIIFRNGMVCVSSFLFFLPFGSFENHIRNVAQRGEGINHAYP